MNMKHSLGSLYIVGLSLASTGGASFLLAQELGYSDTPIIPGTKNHV